MSNSDGVNNSNKNSYKQSSYSQVGRRPGGIGRPIGMAGVPGDKPKDFKKTRIFFKKMKKEPKSLDKLVKQSWEHDVSLALALGGAGVLIVNPIAGMVTFGVGAVWNLSSTYMEKPLTTISKKLYDGYKSFKSHYQ